MRIQYLQGQCITQVQYIDDLGRKTILGVTSKEEVEKDLNLNKAIEKLVTKLPIDLSQ